MQNFLPLLKTEEELRECSKRMQDLVVGVNASINKAHVPNLDNYRIHTDIFNFIYQKIIF